MDTPLALLNDWQQALPLRPDPWSALAAPLGWEVPRLLAELRRLQQAGVISRVGGVFAASAGGAALLAAMAVPTERLDAVAAVVSAHPGVNHNYAREHPFNLWFVMTGVDAAEVERSMRGLEQATGLPALRLPMRRPYRIDLGFDLRGRTAPAGAAERRRGDRAPAVAPQDRALAARVEDGLPLVERPFDAWAFDLGQPVQQVLDTLALWQDQGTLRRFGLIVRHHELGFAANAMAVFDVDDAVVDTLGPLLAAQPGVTLCYRRERAPGWRHNLYAMVHGRDRDAVRQALADATRAAGLQAWPHEVLFSCRRYKQTGARRFRALPQAAEVDHALA